MLTLFRLLNRTLNNGFNAVSCRYVTQNKWIIYDPFWENSVRGPQPRTREGGWNVITVMPGVGVGPEVTECMMQVLECAGAPLHFEIVHPEKNGEEFEAMVHSLHRNGIAIKNNIESRDSRFLFAEHTNNMKVRRIFDLFVDVIECKSFPGLKKAMKIHESIDMVIMRHNLENEYVLLEQEAVPGLVESIHVSTRINSIRLCEYAFDYAMKRGRKKVSLLINQDVDPLIEGLIKDAFDQVAPRYPTIQSEIHTINYCMKMLIKDNKFWDVVITTSMFGFVLTSLLFGLLGSSSILAEANVGHRFQVFEPANRKKFSKGAGKGLANPTSSIMSGVLALETLGFFKQANYIRRSLDEVFEEGKVLTRDLGGKSTTKEFSSVLIERVRDKAKEVLCKFDKLPILPPKPKGVQPYDPKTDKVFVKHLKKT